MEKYVCFRFDVDTELCLREGMPRLLELAEELDCRFTFYVNPGRAIAPLHSVWNALSKLASPNPHRAASLRSISKLGFSELTYILLANPKGLPRHAAVVRDALSQSHQVGQHGGRNHALWQRDALRWSKSRVTEEVRWGRNTLRACGISDVGSFASPGWNSPSCLPDVLTAEGFSMIADRHGTNGKAASSPHSPALIDVPTALTGEPGGVGYLEHHRALGASDANIKRDFDTALEQGHEFLAAYDHPFYAGRHELKLLAKLIDSARDAGYRVDTMEQAITQSTRLQT